MGEGPSLRINGPSESSLSFTVCHSAGRTSIESLTSFTYSNKI